MRTIKENMSLVLKGICMGTAEVIPGVSGGTIAFITGIYEELLDTIKGINFSLIATLKNEGISGFWKAVNGNFLVFLIGGMAAGVVGGVFGVSHLIETFPEMVWAFFFGLIIASALYIGKQVSSWGIGEIVGLVLGTAFAFWITIMNVGQASDALWYVFISGMIAISALILPGISGSFILLLMGMYTFILPTAKKAITTFESESLIFMGVFCLGCLTGLVTFSRVVSWTFKNYKNLTLAVLTGFMLGSLNKLWPWRNKLEWIQKETGEIVTTNPNNEELFKLVKEVSVLPGNYEGSAQIVGVLIAAIAGFCLVFFFDKFGKKI